MKDLDLAYCAGLIDGEGHVAVIDSWRRGLAYKEPRIAVQMTDVTVVEHLRDAFGCGSICYPKTAKAHHIPTARWAVSSRKAYHVAVLLEPFLRVKKQGARAIIDHYGPAGQGQKPDRYSRGEAIMRANLRGPRCKRYVPREMRPENMATSSGWRSSTGLPRAHFAVCGGTKSGSSRAVNCNHPQLDVRFGLPLLCGGDKECQLCLKLNLLDRTA